MISDKEKYKIETSDHQCVGCSGEIPCGGDYYSAVVYAEELFCRRNYCVPCWRIDGDFFAFWKAKRPEQADEPPRRLHFDLQLVLEFFRRLNPRGTKDGEPDGESESESETQKRDLRFVLGLLLIRKKALNFTGSRVENGREWLKLLEKEAAGRVYWVENPELSDQQLEQVREDISDLLQMRV